MTQPWSARMGYGTTSSGPDVFSALIFFLPRGALGGGPRSPARPPAFMWSMPGPLARPEMMLTEGAPPSRLWLLEVGVVGVRASEVPWLSGRDEGAKPEENEIRFCYMTVT